jgi:TPR repeat protein
VKLGRSVMIDSPKLPAKTSVVAVLRADSGHNLAARGLRDLRSHGQRLPISSDRVLKGMFFDACDRRDYEQALQIILFVPDQTSPLVEELFYELAQLTVPSDLYSATSVDEEEEFARRLDESWKVVVVLRSAADNGHPVAQDLLGDVLLGWEGCLAEALMWKLTAAEQGSASSQFDLGIIYAEGERVPRNYEEALTWFRRAAAQNFSAAQFKLGRMNYEGKGTPQDFAEAYKWFRRAAESKSPGVANDAQFMLAEMHHNGEGLARSHVQAMMWLSIILKRNRASGFDIRGNALREKVRAQLTPVEITEAEELAETWLKSHAS